jgi:hypothetical protein
MLELDVRQLFDLKVGVRLIGQGIKLGELS